jgi:hypothetical protein
MFSRSVRAMASQFFSQRSSVFHEYLRSVRPVQSQS